MRGVKLTLGTIAVQTITWKIICNLIVTAILIVIAGFYAHAFEQWFVERLANALNIHNFSSYITMELFNWLPTILVGFLLSVLIFVLTFEPGKIWWILLAACLLVALSVRDRKSYWTDEASIIWETMADARHIMYLFGALAAVLVIKLVQGKLKSTCSELGQKPGR